MKNRAATIAILAATACGGDDDPSNANLQGWWLHDEGNRATVFGFVAAADAATTLDLEGVTAPPGEDISAVYLLGNQPGFAALYQLATYEVSGNLLRQTVLGDVMAPPGTMYETEIRRFGDGELVIESMNDPSGMRTYVSRPRCPPESLTGWTEIRGVGETPFPLGASLAVDARGGVHGFFGDTMGGDTYWHLGDACAPKLAAPPAFDLSAVAVRGDEVHAILQARSPSPPVLRHHWRPAPGAAWQTTDIPGTGAAMYNLGLFVDGAALIAVAGRTDGGLQIFRHDGAAWSAVAVTTPTMMRMEAAALGPDGTIAILGLNTLRLIRGTTVEDVALPRLQIDRGINGGVRFDAQGRVHAAWSYATLDNDGPVVGARGVYGVYDGSSWTQHELGPAVYIKIVTTPDGPMRVVHGNVTAAFPQLSLTEIAADGTLHSERLAITPDGGRAQSPGAAVRFAADAGPDGTIAATLDGRYIAVRFPQRLRTPQTVTFQAVITGPGRVFTDDGLLDCRQTCSVEIPIGTRLQVRMAPNPGYAGFSGECPWIDSDALYGWCWHDVVGLAGTTVQHAFQFAPP